MQKVLYDSAFSITKIKTTITTKPTFHSGETHVKICILRAAQVSFGEESKKKIQIAVQASPIFQSNNH